MASCFNTSFIRELLFQLFGFEKLLAFDRLGIGSFLDISDCFSVSIRASGTKNNLRKNIDKNGPY
jgi:hypothetical protein